MRRILAIAAIAGGMSVCALAEDFTGFVMDKNCASNKSMIGDSACAERCIGRGAPAVLVTNEGKVYQISNQDKVKSAAGKKVTISGKMDKDSITVDSVKVLAD